MILTISLCVYIKWSPDTIGLCKLMPNKNVNPVMKNNKSVRFVDTINLLFNDADRTDLL